MEPDKTSGTAKKPMSGQDQAVMQTSNDALMTKVYAASLGYFQDDYSQLFLKGKKKMLPIISRGTWARVFGVRQVINRYLKAYAERDGPIQIVSLGAGYDTTYFWIQDQIAQGALPASLKEKLNYFEFDYSDVVSKKLQIIKKNESLWRHLWSSPEELLAHDSDADLNLSGYKISSGDIRDIQALTEKFKALGVNAEAPVLVLTECVLVYLKPDEARRILSFVKDYFVGDRLLLNYEMIKPDDPFGKVMLENLEDRGCRLQGIHECPDEAAQVQRLNVVAGLDQAECYNMSDVYLKKLDPAERSRIEKLEIFDEFEEWDLLQSHYCLCLGKRISDKELSQQIHI